MNVNQKIYDSIYFNVAKILTSNCLNILPENKVLTKESLIAKDVNNPRRLGEIPEHHCIGTFRTSRVSELKMGKKNQSQ